MCDFVKEGCWGETIRTAKKGKEQYGRKESGNDKQRDNIKDFTGTQVTQLPGWAHLPSSLLEGDGIFCCAGSLFRCLGPGYQREALVRCMLLHCSTLRHVPTVFSPSFGLK